MIRTRIPSNDAAIWGRVIRADKANLSPGVARAILRFCFDAHDRRRMHELLDKNRNGELTRSECKELESYRRVGLLLDLLSSKARQSLRKPARSA